jgi:hypothetical protein
MSWQGGKEAGMERQNEAVMQGEADKQAERIKAERTRESWRGRQPGLVNT